MTLTWTSENTNSLFTSNPYFRLQVEGGQLGDGYSGATAALFPYGDSHSLVCILRRGSADSSVVLHNRPSGIEKATGIVRELSPLVEILKQAPGLPEVERNALGRFVNYIETVTGNRA